MNEQHAIPPGIPVNGWSYCPRCDKDTMVTVEVGKLMQCPMCGLGVAIETNAYGSTSLEIKEPLQVIEAMRYQHYLQAMYQRTQAAGAQTQAGDVRDVRIFDHALTPAEIAKQYQALTTPPPRRVRLAWRLCNQVARCFGCRIVGIIDLKDKIKSGGV